MINLGWLKLNIKETQECRSNVQYMYVMPRVKESHSTFSNLDYSFPVHHKNWIMQLWLMSYELMTPKSSNDQIFLYALCGDHMPQGIQF